MPSTVTHSLFVKDVCEILPSNIVSKLDLNRCRGFAHGTDSLMFYLSNKNIRKLHFYSHENKTRDFFVNLLNYVRSNQIKDKDTYSFIVGFICHYILDTTMHPFIIYKTGDFDRKNPSTYKYNNVHHFMETFIDNDMIRRRLRKYPYKYDFCKDCFDNREFSNELDDTINHVFYDTYDVKDMGKIYYKSLKKEKLFLTLFRRDRYGIKKFFYKLLDTVTPRSCFRFEALSYHYPLDDRHNFLNSDNKIWRNPTDYDMTSKESFVDLYVKALKEAKVAIKVAFDYIDGKNVVLEDVFTNLSYYTGLDCEERRELKYFEF